jgi:hypothetical protein
MPRTERPFDEKQRPKAEESASTQGDRRPDEAMRSEGQGHDVYGCVDWFDYCPLPRTDPPVRHRG